MSPFSGIHGKRSRVRDARFDTRLSERKMRVLAHLSSCLTIPIALYKPQIVPPARKGKTKVKNGIWPHREKGEKMAEKWENGHF